MELTTAQQLVLLLAGLIYGFTKTGILGLTSLLTPLLLYFFTPSQSLGIALPMLLFADLLALVVLRKSVSWRHVLLALPWALLGIFISWRFLNWIQGNMDLDAANLLLQRLIAGMLSFVVVSGAVLRIVRSRRPAPPEAVDAPPTPMSRPRFLFASLVALLGGLITMIANNSAPAWVVYLMLFRLDKYHFLGTAAWIICIINMTKMPFSIQLGYVTWDTFRINLYMAPLVVVGVFLGRWVIGRISQKFFDNLVQALALSGALYLLLK